MPLLCGTVGGGGGGFVEVGSCCVEIDLFRLDISKIFISNTVKLE